MVVQCHARTRCEKVKPRNIVQCEVPTNSELSNAVMNIDVGVCGGVGHWVGINGYDFLFV